jgi:hypothetical protein
MKTYYYYDRDEDRKPMTTHCLLNNDGILSKGIARCSEKDSPCKKLGKSIAYGRAVQAMENNCSQMDKGAQFWKKISHDLIFSHLTSVDKKILRM